MAEPEDYVTDGARDGLVEASASEASEIDEPVNGAAAEERRSQAGRQWVYRVRRIALPLLGVAFLLVFAGYYRFRHLGYSEFQGDEARAALLARHILDGGGWETLLWHKKGPLEVVVPAVMMSRGDIREGTARLPFACAGLLVVLVVFDLGRRMWGLRAGWLAAIVLAIDGYLIAFSRIVQYQSFVLLLGALGVWCAYRWYSKAAHEDIYLALAGLLTGLATWAHYEAVFAGIPVAWLVFARGRSERWPATEWLRRLLLPATLGVAVVALFYVPFARHPQFEATGSYIVGRRIGGGLYFKLGDYFNRACFYNSSYYVILLASALAAAVALQLRAALGRRGRLAVALWLTASAVLLVAPGLFELAGQSLAIFVFLPVASVVLASVALPNTWRAVFAWFASSFLVAGFLVLKPHTHFYTMMPAGALLAGWLANRVCERYVDGEPRRRAIVAVGVLALLLAAFALHQHVVFVRHEPEYKRVYPAARLPGYWVPFGTELPRGGYFGFPYRAGWNEVQSMFLDGELQGDYDSNEEILITGWYTWGAVRCTVGPDHYLVAWNPQDEEEIPTEDIQRDYHQTAVVRVGEREKLWVWAAHEGGSSPLRIDDLGGMNSIGGPASPFSRRPLPVSQALELPLPQMELDVELERGIRLIGADFPGSYGAGPPLATTGVTDPTGASNVPESEPARSAILPADVAIGTVLLWRSERALNDNYSVFVHLTDEAGRIAAQSDGWPCCGSSPTSSWQPNEVYFDGHTLRTTGALAPGQYSLRVGMYDPESLVRLGVVNAGSAMEVVDSAVVLRRYEVRP